MQFPYVLEAGWQGGTVACSRERFLADMVPGLGDPEYLALLDPADNRLCLLVDTKGAGLYAPPRGNPRAMHADLKPGDRIARIYHALRAERLPDGSEHATGQVLVVEIARASGKVQIVGLSLDTAGALETVMLDGGDDARNAGR